MTDFFSADLHHPHFSEISANFYYQKTHIDTLPQKENKVHTKNIIELGGTILFDDLSQLYQLIDTSSTVDSLKEDLLQAVFPNDQILDIGWYPEFCENGTFRGFLINEYDWEHPTFSDRARNWEELHKAISNALKTLEI